MPPFKIMWLHQKYNNNKKYLPARSKMSLGKPGSKLYWVVDTALGNKKISPSILKYLFYIHFIS